MERAGARHHDQGQAVPRHLEGARAQPHRHARASTSLRVSRSLQACEGSCSWSMPRRASRHRHLANAYLAIENGLRDRPVANKIDLPAADRTGRPWRSADLLGDDPPHVLRISAQDGDAGVADVLDAIVERVPTPAGDPDAPAARSSSTPPRPVPRRRRLRPGRGRLVLQPRGAPDDGHRHPLRRRGARRLLPGHDPRRGAHRRRGGLRRDRAEGRLAAPRRRHAHLARAPCRHAASRLPGREADGLRRHLPDRLGRLSRAPRCARAASSTTPLSC